MTTETETILIVAEHPHIATLWMQLNGEALKHPDGIEVRVVVQTERATRSNRAIIIGQPKRKVVEWARNGATTQVVRMQHTDRLAAGWRTA